MTVTTSSAPRTYGGWRERRGFGIAGMDGRATAVAIGVGVLALGIGMFTTAGLLADGPRAAGRRRGHGAALAR